MYLIIHEYYMKYKEDVKRDKTNFKKMKDQVLFIWRWGRRFTWGISIFPTEIKEVRVLDCPAIFEIGVFFWTYKFTTYMI